MEKVKIFVVGGATEYASWIDNHVLVDNIEDADIVLFTGGEDVDPSMYKKEKHPRTVSNIRRDEEEMKIFKSIKPHQLALGICRGSQFLCVANGGILVQDCTGHAIYGTHEITNGEIVTSITSTHHQMQYPYTINKKYYNILYRALPERSHYYDGDSIRRPNEEPEIVLYKVEGNPVSLAIQGHPEIMRKDAPVINILNELVSKCVQEIR